jgi:hypothetical protein
MPMLDQRIQCQISDLSEACMRYWELRGIAPKDRMHMQIELEHHFVQAALDGKSLEAVTGPHPAAFAEAWAREMHPRLVRGGVLLLPEIAYALGVVSTTAFVQQVLAPASPFPFTLFAAFLLLGNGLCALLFPLEGFLAPRIRTRTGRLVLLAAGLGLVGLVLREAGVRVNWGMPLLSWNWPLTVVLLVLAVLSGLLAWKTTNQERVFSDHRAPLIRSALAWVGSVAVFDLLLIVGSLAAFNVCTLAGRLF